MPQSQINIVVIGDRMVDVGLHVTLYSLLEKSTFGFHFIHYITQDYDEITKDQLEYTLKKFKDCYSLEVIECDGSAFDKYKGLHGNTFTYSKLLISELIRSDYVLYLDIDIVVNIDIREFEPYLDKIDNYLIMANPERPLNESLEKDFLIKQLGLKNEMYYNAGVLLLNLKKWRNIELSNRLIGFAEEYANYLKCADQTVINGVISDADFGELPDFLNLRVENYLPRNYYNNRAGVLHYYGRPKPWDLFASKIHPHYQIFEKVLKKTYFKDYPSFADFNYIRIQKFFRTLKSYIKVFFRIKL